MSDQNQFDQYKQKLLHYWSLFLAGCGKFWEKVKVYSKKAAVLISSYAVAFGQMLMVFAGKALEWLKKLWQALQRGGRRLLQILATWLLLAKEKSEPVIQRLTERVRSFIPEKTGEAPALPAVEADIVEAEEPEPEAVEAPAEEVPKKEPAWKSYPWMVKTAAVFAAIGVGMRFLGKWIRRLYKFVMAAPVVWAAIKFAMENMERLPEEVGLDIQSTGEFARMISRGEAVFWPLGITMFCLVLMFCSKKPILPWVISVFTLVLPWLIWILNYYA